MRKITLTLIAIIFAFHFSYAQFTTSGSNIYYNGGYVGIGTISPVSPLDVNGILSFGGRATLSNNVSVSSLYTGTTYFQVVNASGSTNLFTVLNSGNVGVGTAAPASQLDIFHRGTGTTLRVGGYAIGTPKDAGIDLYAANGSAVPAYARIGLGVDNGAIGVESGYLDFSTINAGALTEKMRITKEGYVGIGTTSPSELLDVNGQLLIEGVNSLNLGNSSHQISNNDGIIIAQNTAGQDITINNAQSNNILFKTANTERFRVDGAGNLAIGTTDPKGYKLAVNGGAIATSMTVKLQSNWPDYVFKPTYHLPTLAEIKTYIDQNHHLPDLPSEQEVAKDGINLGEMNKLLTKKVEELTLYLIEQKEQLTEQQKVNGLLQTQINDIVKQLKSK